MRHYGLHWDQSGKVLACEYNLASPLAGLETPNRPIYDRILTKTEWPGLGRNIRNTSYTVFKILIDSRLHDQKTPKTFFFLKYVLKVFFQLRLNKHREGIYKFRVNYSGHSPSELIERNYEDLTKFEQKPTVSKSNASKFWQFVAGLG